MIEKLNDFADNIAAFRCHGRMTKTDYETVLMPDIEDKRKRHKKLRAYTEIAPDFSFGPDAIWAGMKFGLRHFFSWERGALVTDLAWMHHAAKFYGRLGFLIPGGFRAFPTAEANKARDWIGEPQG
ncbi:STAS/SEC14 domain-containing protein [Mycobacterium gastri]|uniref:STAS/SEC14 domain-containing protein n=1 Tax=Mycobacterium gastri TaxID=1777 RepID=A0A1X1VA41_MYCGS|nr:STAS/SEC14 domain-containing protein [Mycobacterium gastri]ORV65927.1 hypothetical protein AWC07_12575 [Mycobacterium gastri]